MNGFIGNATMLLTGPVREELKEKTTPLSANAAMRICRQFLRAEAGELHGIARVAGDHRKPNADRCIHTPTWAPTDNCSLGHKRIRY
jgi:hypothetical protein